VIGALLLIGLAKGVLPGLVLALRTKGFGPSWDRRAMDDATRGLFAERGGRTLWIGVGLLVVVALVVLTFLNPYYLRILIIDFLYAYLASCWNIVGSYAGQMSLGHAIFFGVGSYTAAVFGTEGWGPIILAFPVAVLLSGAFAVVLALIGFRYALRGIYFAVGTLLLTEIVL